MSVTIEKEIIFSCEKDHERIWFESYDCPLCEDVPCLTDNLKTLLKELEEGIGQMEDCAEVILRSHHVDEKIQEIRNALFPTIKEA